MLKIRASFKRHSFDEECKNRKLLASNGQLCSSTTEPAPAASIQSLPIVDNKFSYGASFSSAD